jgi:polysaccharide biosynthesis protein PslJ
MTGIAVADRPNGQSYEPRLTLPRWDGASLLVLLVAMNVLVPSAYAISAIGGVATPANLLGMLALVWWFNARLLGGSDLATGPQPVRVAIKVFGLAVLLSYIAAASRPLSGDEVTAADRGVLDLLTWVGVALVAVDGIRDRRRLDAVLKAVAAGGAFVGAIAFLQFFAGLDPAAALKLPGLSLVRVITSVDIRSGYRRVAGTAVHPIEFGVVMAMTLPIALHYAFYATTKWAKRWHWFCAGLIGVALPLSLSRTAILGVTVVGLMLFFTWSWKRRGRALVVLVVFVNGLQFVVPGLFGTLRSLFLNLGNDPSVSGRTSDYALVGDLVASNPVFGRGFRTFIPEKYILHTGEGGGTLILDNQYLGTLIETGVFGLLSLLFLFVVVLFCTRSVRRRSADLSTRDLAQSVAAAVMVAMLSFATFDGLSFPMATILLFLLVGCAGALRRTVLAEQAAEAQAAGARG